MKSYGFCLSLSDLFHLVYPCCYKWQNFILFYGCEMYVSHIFFIHLSLDGYLDCFHILAIVNNAAMNIRVHISFSISVFIFFTKTPRSGIAGLYGSSIFNVWRKFHAVFHRGCISINFKLKN